MFRLASALALSATAASAGGLAPPIQPVAVNAMAFAVPTAVASRCPVVPAVVEELSAQGFTRVVTEPGEDYARFSALRDGQWTVVVYDCDTGARVFQDAVVVADADLVDDGYYILDGTDVDLTGAPLADISDVQATGADLSAEVAADASVSADTVVLGNARAVEGSALTRIDASAGVDAAGF